MAIIHAQKEGFQDLVDRIPPGRIWASPDKPKGYLRKSVLTVLAKKIGDHELPHELIESGTFDDTDPSTSSQVRDEVTAIKTEIAYREHEDRAKRGEKEDEDETEDEDTS